MEIESWYSFEDDNHTYGYTLFYPLRKNKNQYYGLYFMCNDYGRFIEFGLATLNNKSMIDNAENFYFDKWNPKPHNLIIDVFEDNVLFSGSNKPTFKKDSGFLN